MNSDKKPKRSLLLEAILREKQAHKGQSRSYEVSQYRGSDQRYEVVNRSEETQSNVVMINPLNGVEEDDDDDTEFQKDRIRQEEKAKKKRSKQIAQSKKARAQFRNSIRKMEVYLKETEQSEESGSLSEQPNQHCIDPSRENAIIRFLVSKRGRHNFIAIIYKRSILNAFIILVFGYPSTDGTIRSNYFQFVRNNHPILSMCLLHRLNPFGRKERIIVFCNALFFSIFISFVIFYTSSFRQVI